MKNQSLLVLLGVLASCSSDLGNPSDAAVARELGITEEQVREYAEKKQLSNKELMDAPDVLRDAIAAKAAPPTGAQSYIDYQMLRMRDENGNIPHDASMKALEQMESLRTEAPCGGLTPEGWKDEGPGRIGGRVRTIVINPTNNKYMFCGSVGGGIWRSTNAGASWSRVNDRMENLAVTSIVISPISTKIMLAATGEGFSNGDRIRGAGIFRSINSGASWTRLASTNTSDFYWTNRLSYASNGGVVLAATGSGVWRSTDNGTTWTKVRTGRSRDVKFKPGSATRAIAESASTGSAHYTVDGGLTWTACAGLSAGGSKRTEYAWSSGYTGRGAGVVYALKDSSSSLYRSVDGGANFTLVSTNTMLGTQGWYDNALWVAPYPKNASTTDDIIVAGGIDLWRSTDAGNSFTRISRWSSWPNSAHADHHAIVADPGYDGQQNLKVWFGNDGGVWSTDNVLTVALTSGWDRRNENLGITQYYGASTHPKTGIVIGGTQDNGTSRRDSTSAYNTWTRPSGGDGGYTASDPTNSNYHYAEYQNGRLRRSTNGAASFSNLRTFTGSLFIAPFVLDHNSPDTLYYGAGDLWRSTNVKAATPSWTAIHTPSGAVSAIGLQDGSSDQLWVGHTNGDIYRSTDATAAAPTFTKLDGSLPNRFVERLVVDPNNADRVFACLGSYSTNNLWETTDGGTTWTAKTGLPSAPVTDLEFNPKNGNTLYVSTGVGVLASEDNGATWCSSGSPANVSCEEMFWGANDKLYVATHGRGIWSFELGDAACLETTMAGGNGLLAANGGNMFDANVLNPAGINITSLDVRSRLVSGNFDIEVYITPGGYSGKEGNAAVWTLASTGSADSAGSAVPTSVDVDDFFLPAGTWGVYVLYLNGGMHYTNGNGTNQTASNADLALSLGIGKTAKFGGSTYSPRVWNGRICYSPADRAAIGHYGWGCGGGAAGIPQWSFSCPPALGMKSIGTVTNMNPAGGPVFWWIGLINNSGLDLSAIGMPGCSLFSFPIATTLAWSQAGGTSTGFAWTLGTSSSLIGAKVGMQMGAVDAGANALGVSMTDAIALRIGN